MDAQALGWGRNFDDLVGVIDVMFSSSIFSPATYTEELRLLKKKKGKNKAEFRLQNQKK